MMISLWSLLWIMPACGLVGALWVALFAANKQCEDCEYACCTSKKRTVLPTDIDIVLAHLRNGGHMSYDISLLDPVTMKTIEFDSPHDMRGGTYAMNGTKEATLNITYNYANYYYDATDADPRFAHDEVSAYYSDGTTGPIQTRYGIRGINGKSGAESIPMLEDMIRSIEEKYKKDGQWIETARRRTIYYDAESGEKLDLLEAIRQQKTDYRKEVLVGTISEGPNRDYWESTAGNAIRPLHQLIAMAKMRPDGKWQVV